MGVKSLLALLLAVAGLAILAPPAQAADLANTVPPSISGHAKFDAELVADPGEWTPPATSYSYRWLRDGEPIKGARDATYHPGLDDLGHRISVRVAAADDAGQTGTATSAETEPIERAQLRAKGGQEVAGIARYTHTLTARPGRWNAEPTRLRFQWRRNRVDIPGATARRFAIRPEDLGARLRVRITAKAPGYEEASVTTHPTRRVQHRVDVRRVVRYHIESRGHVTASLRKFAVQAQETFDDPRGWRAAGIDFRRVAGGGSMTLVLAEARTVPSFSSACSADWSCRVGRFVIINQTRWLHASPAWNAAHGPLRGYRHMVVNHETGHFLGLGHSGCPGKGRPAPVMMQQSKGLHGCRFNSWPIPREIAGRTPSSRSGPPGGTMARGTEVGLPSGHRRVTAE